ncbi:MAG: hypothetical protein AAGK47_04245 [Bacteroidota bacterium]
MPRRTQISDFKKIKRADDLERIVKDKRVNKRANKQKRSQRNRHYEKTLLRNLKRYGIDEEE